MTEWTKVHHKPLVHWLRSSMTHLVRDQETLQDLFVIYTPHLSRSQRNLNLGNLPLNDVELFGSFKSAEGDGF